jgi:ankyrin repeat protein
MPGADVNARDETYSTPLHYACTNVNGAELVYLLLEHRADVSPHDAQTRATPLHVACKQGAYGNAELLLKHKANPNAIDIHKNTPLHVACASGYAGIEKLLIGYHAETNVINADGVTPADLTGGE